MSLDPGPGQRRCTSPVRRGCKISVTSSNLLPRVIGADVVIYALRAIWRGSPGTSKNTDRRSPTASFNRGMYTTPTKGIQGAHLHMTVANFFEVCPQTPLIPVSLFNFFSGLQVWSPVPGYALSPHIVFDASDQFCRRLGDLDRKINNNPGLSTYFLIMWSLWCSVQCLDRLIYTDEQLLYAITVGREPR